MKNNTTKMCVRKGKQLVYSSFTCQHTVNAYVNGDRNSGSQTKHGVGHAQDVLKLGLQIAALDEEAHGPMNQIEKDVILPGALFYHDIGRCLGVDNHDVTGGRWFMDFMPTYTLTGDNETLPHEWCAAIARCIINHRADRYRNCKLDYRPLHILLLADKCVGDEERVRPGRARILRILRALSFGPIRLTALPMRQGHAHDRANFAIKHFEMTHDSGELVLRITMDYRVCLPELIYHLYGDRYHCCAIAARKLGFKDFAIEFNGTRYHEVAEGDWRAD